MTDRTSSNPIRTSGEEGGRRYESELEAIMDGVRPDVAEVDSALEDGQTSVIGEEALDQLDMYPESNRNPAAYSR